MFGKTQGMKTGNAESEEWSSDRVSPHPYACLPGGIFSSSKPEVKHTPRTISGIKASVNPNAMSKAELLAAIHANTKIHFSNSDEYTKVQLKLFLYAVSQDATLDELITAGMRDCEEKTVERKPYKSTDSEFKTIMHLLVGDDNETALRKSAADKILSIYMAWEAAKIEVKPPRAKLSNTGNFRSPKTAPPTSLDDPDAQLLDFFSHPAAR